MSLILGSSSRFLFTFDRMTYQWNQTVYRIDLGKTFADFFLLLESVHFCTNQISEIMFLSKNDPLINSCGLSG